MLHGGGYSRGPLTGHGQRWPVLQGWWQAERRPYVLSFWHTKALRFMRLSFAAPADVLPIFCPTTPSRHWPRCEARALKKLVTPIAGQLVR